MQSLIDPQPLSDPDLRRSIRLLTAEAERRLADAEAVLLARDRRYAEQQAKEWATKKEISDRVRSLFGDTIPEPGKPDRSVTWRLIVWDRDGDRRIYIRERDVEFGKEDVEYYHSGTSKYPPRKLRLFYDIKRKVRETPGLREEISTFCAEIGSRWRSLDLVCNL